MEEAEGLKRVPKGVRGFAQGRTSPIPSAFAALPRLVLATRAVPVRNGAVGERTSMRMVHGAEGGMLRTIGRDPALGRHVPPAYARRYSRVLPSGAGRRCDRVGVRRIADDIGAGSDLDGTAGAFPRVACPREGGRADEGGGLENRHGAAPGDGRLTSAQVIAVATHSDSRRLDASPSGIGGSLAAAQLPKTSSIASATRRLMLGRTCE